MTGKSFRKTSRAVTQKLVNKVPALQSCVCGSDAAKYATLGDPTACFGANDVTNLEILFGGLATTAAMRTFYARCADYDGSGVFQANDLTNMKRYFVGLLPIAPHLS